MINAFERTHFGDDADIQKVLHDQLQTNTPVNE